MRTHHYLGLRALVGKTLRYVAVVDDRWLALLGWQGAALKCQSRDAWIGWPPVLHYQRLHLIANNSRFLVLERIPNLASRVLSLNLKRLSDDWLAVHGHPLLLAETFVDLSRFTGACYRAANWLVVGHTLGYRKSGARYFRHDHPKQVLLYPLNPRAREHLCQLLPNPSWSCEMKTNSLSAKQLEDLQRRLRSLPDCRKARGIRHRFASVLAISIGAILGGARGYAAIAEWASRLTQKQLKRLWACFNRRTKRYEPPSEPTIRRVLQKANAGLVDKTFGEWFMSINGPNGNIAVDGKTLKGAHRSDGSQVHLLSAFLHQQGTTVAQLEVGAKTNEIPEIKPLLDPLDLRGRVVTADSLHTQRETARYLVEDKGADYVFIVKDNQKTLREDIEVLDQDDFSPCARDAG